MKLDGTYRQLYDIRKDIYEESKKHPSYSIFHKQKIKDFFSRNAVRLNILDEKIQQGIQKFVLHDQDNKPESVSEDGKPAMWAYEKDETQKEHADYYNALMATQITIEC